jgi:hypothetical protein
MHAGDGNVHTNIPVNSDNYEMLQTATRRSARIMALARARRRDLGRARHRHHQARVPHRRRNGAVPRLQGSASTPKAASTRASCCRAATCRPDQRLHAQLRPDGHESLIMQQSDIGAISDERQGLPALRQVQAGVRHARAARQPALQPAQQDPRHLAADRGLPVRGADPPRRVAASTGTSSRTWPTTARCATSA